MRTHIPWKQPSGWRRFIQRMKDTKWARFVFVSMAIIGLVAFLVIVILDSHSLGQDAGVNAQFIISIGLSMLGIAISLFLVYFPPTPLDNSDQLLVVPPHQPRLPGDAPPWDVPYQHNLFFVDYQDILRHLHETFTSGKAKRQVISGMGGIGKTQTAVEYAHSYRKDYQYVFWARAGSAATLVSDYVNIAQLVELPLKNDLDQNVVVSAIKRWLEIKMGWLLILDDVNDFEMVNDFLPTGGTGHILLTSRTEAIGNFVGNCEGVVLKEMEPKDGALFLLRRLKIIAQNALLGSASPADRAKAEDISQEVGGLPLALDQAGAYILEQAGAYIKVTEYDLSAYLKDYRKAQTKLLRQRGGLDTTHPDPVATTWSLSFKKVKKANRAAAELLRFCSFLYPDAIPEEIITRGATYLGWTLGRIATDQNNLNSAISVLRKYSLVHRIPNQMLTIHPLVQTVLKDKMRKFIQRRWARRAVLAINRAFPSAEVETWQHCRRLISQATVCMELIDQWHLSFPEATRLLNNAGYYLYEHAQYTEAEQLYQRALTIHERVLGAEHPNTALSLNNLAELYRSQGKYEQAEPLYQRALAIRERVLGPEHPDTAQSLNNLAALYYNQGKYKQAEPLYRRALVIHERVLGAEHPSTATSLANLAALYYNQGKYEQAEPLYRRALVIREKVLGPEHPSTATSLANLAALYYNQGKYEQAEPLYRRALAIREKVLGPEHPDTTSSLNNLAELYRSQGKYEQAEPLYRRALAIREKMLGAEHPNTALSLNNLAGLYMSQGKYEQAEPLYQRALAIRERVLGAEHPDTAQSLNNLAELYRSQGKYEQAEPLYQRALVIHERVLGAEHPNTATILNNLALLYYNQGKYEQAEPLYRRALAICEKVLGAEHPDTAQSLNNLAELYRSQGKYEQAEPLYRRALAIRERVLGPDHPNTATVQENYDGK